MNVLFRFITLQIFLCFTLVANAQIGEVIHKVSNTKKYQYQGNQYSLKDVYQYFDENSDALKQYNKYKRAVNFGRYVAVGGGLIAGYGLLSLTKEKGIGVDIQPGTFEILAGIAVGLVGVTVLAITSNSQRKSVRMHNRSKGYDFVPETSIEFNVTGSGVGLVYRF